MKISNYFQLLQVALLLIFFTLQTKESSAQSSPPQCVNCVLTNQIDITTGIDHFLTPTGIPTQALYGTNTNEEFWSIVSGPVPLGCATNHGSNVIGAGPSGVIVPATHVGVCAGPAIPGNGMYIFERRFRVCRDLDFPITCPVDLNLTGFRFGHLGSDCAISSIQLVGPPAFGTQPLYLGPCFDFSPLTPIPLIITSFPVVPEGEYYLRLTIRNNSNWGGPTHLGFSFEGTVSSASTAGCNSNALVENAHYGKRTLNFPASCAPLYGACSYLFQADLLGNKCIPINTSGTFTIDPYCSNSTYTFDDGINPIITASSSSITLSTGTYTMTVTDAENCSYTKTIYIGGTTLSVTSVAPCETPPNGSTGLILNITNVAPITEYRINLGPWLPYTPPLSPIVGIGSHTVEIRDYNGCLSSATVDVGNDFTASLTASPLCFNPTATLTVTTNPSPLVGTIMYSYNAGAPTLSNPETIGTGGPQNVIVIDPFNSACNQTATTIAYGQPNITITVPGGGCPKMLIANATPPDPTYQYSWNGNPSSTNNQFVASGSGLYTVTVSNDSCSATQMVPVTCHSCLDPLVPTAGLIIPNGASSSSMGLVNYSSTQNIIIEKDFIVDANTLFFNCPNVLLGPDARIIVQPGVLFELNNSHLRSACNEMWNGIVGGGVITSGTGIKISNSIIEDMEFGVQSLGGTNLDITGTQFIDNYRGLYVQNADNQFDITNNRCIIHSNTFTSTGNPLLPLDINFPNISAGPKGEYGIYLETCENVEVGGLYPATMGNTFDNLFCGIFVKSDNAGFIENYNLKYNIFTNINDDLTSTSPYGNDNDIYNNLFGTHRGAGIFCPWGNQSTTNTHTINITGSGDNDYFDNCDKAVVTTGINTNIDHTYVTNSLFGHILVQTDGHDYNVNSNSIKDAFMGIHLNGNTNLATISANGVECRQGGIQLAPTFTAYPLGIQLQHYFPDPSNQVRVVENNIDLNDIDGDGILMQNAGPRVYVGFNSIRFLSASIANTDHWIRGISAVRCEGPVVEENTINGQTNFLSLLYPTPLQNRLSSALFTYQSPDMTLRCNQMDNTHEGFQIMGDCNTSPTRVSGNQFHDHVVPMHFREAIIGLEGTVGDIGTLSNNNDNNFSSGTNPSFPSPHNNLGQFGNAIKVYRTTSTPSIPNNERIFFDPAIIATQVLTNESWSTVGATNYYEPFQNNFGPNYPSQCISTFYPEYTEPDGKEHIQGDEEVPVAIDSVQYYQFAEVAEWMDENRLYRHLDKEPITRNAHTEYTSFYTSESNEPTKFIWEADQALIALQETNAMTDPIVWEQKYQQAVSANNLIASSKSYEINEKVVNTFYLKMLKFGPNSLTATEKTNIQTLAESCPFKEGNAVYKARMLQANVTPGRFYNNKKICEAAGVYKNGNPSDKLDQTFKNGMGRHGNEELGTIELFPNPNQGHLQVKYDIAESATLIFYDMLGREMKRIELNNDLDFAHYSLTLNKGVYLWKCISAKGIVATGKLTMD